MSNFEILWKSGLFLAGSIFLLAVTDGGPETGVERISISVFGFIVSAFVGLIFAIILDGIVTRKSNSEKLAAYGNLKGKLSQKRIVEICEKINEAINETP